MGSRYVVIGALIFAPTCLAGTFIYEISAQIRYDVVIDGKMVPDTIVWGMPGEATAPSGTFRLSIDDEGNVRGSSPANPVSGLGALLGELLLARPSFMFALAEGSWGPPEADVAPLARGTVDLKDTFLGDFSGLGTITGFIKDGNSGDLFDLSNGVGLDGKFEFTASGPDGMSLTFKAKGTNAGSGTGWYTLALDGGELAYRSGSDAAAAGIVGVVAYQVWIDAAARTFLIPEAVVVQGFPAEYLSAGNRIEDFNGSIDSAGVFVGSARFSGIDFSSLTVSTTEGRFEDGNSAGFDPGDGLVPGDEFRVVMTDTTGRFDLVINGTLLPADSCQSDAECYDADPCTIDSCDASRGCRNVTDESLAGCQSSPGTDTNAEAPCLADGRCVGAPPPSPNEEAAQTQPDAADARDGVGPVVPIGCGAFGTVCLGVAAAVLGATRFQQRRWQHRR